MLHSKMKIPILFFLLVGVLSVIGSPVDSSKTVVEPLSLESLESLEESLSVEDSNDSTDGHKIAGSLSYVQAAVEKVSDRGNLNGDKNASESLAEAVAEEADLSEAESVPERIDLQVSKELIESEAEHIDLPGAGELIKSEAEPVPEHVDSPVVSETIAEESAERDHEELIKESAEEHAESNLTSKVESIVETVSTSDAVVTTNQPSRKVGPVELGLLNVVTASAIAAEEIYMEMTALNAETSHMIHTKVELLTAHTMNELFVPLNKVETKIKKSEECGKRYVSALNMIFKDINTALMECTKNLTTIDEQYTKENVETLNLLSNVGDEITSLSQACGMENSFIVGTFCVVNNLADINEHVVSQVNTIKQNTVLVKEDVKQEVKATETCQQKLVEDVTQKVNNLQKEVEEKCIQRKE